MFIKRMKHVINQDLNDDSDGLHVTSFGIVFYKETKENELSQSVVFMCTGPLKIGIMLELEKVSPKRFR